MIHQTAIIDPSARIGEGVSIGPFSVIGPDVEIGANTWIGPHVVIQGPTKIGKNNRIFQFASIGEMPQDLKYRGETTYLEIGDRNVIREFCTFNRGTAQDKSITRVGSDNLFMAYVHIAHDCIVGNHTVFANNASLAGHVIVEDFAVMGGFAGVLQFCRMGKYSFASMGSMIDKDVPPFVKVSGYYAKPFGLNSIGLTRRGFMPETIRGLRQAYRAIYRQGLTVKEALKSLEDMLPTCPDIKLLIDFIQASQRGIVR
ncbi:MAG: acyl-ACP--UDP-N-acetylglucosamine O-acyltransferase [Gammaproteobacteria bacterium]|nr:acyl-ACP--UDP-N-acetylglucosamine O-acyltransferase [Gammaproteobacteria bacterium]